jgi:hypothetical protein
METALAHPPLQPTPPDAEKQAEFLLDALKQAVATPGEHRLFRWGKLSGLFPSRVGPSAAAAKRALADGLLEHVRTEARGKLIVEWVRARPWAVEYLHDHDSPKAVLRELQDVIGATRAGVPVWMAQARDEAAQLAMRFEHTAREMIRRLDALAERVEAALQRVEIATPTLSHGLIERIPWAEAALTYLDHRGAGGAGWCRMSEFFQAAKSGQPDLGVTTFHDGVRKLYDGGLIRLSPPADPEAIREPEYAVEIDGQMMWVVGR